MKRSTSRVIMVVLLLVISTSFCCIFGFPSVIYTIKRVMINSHPPTPDPLIQEITNAFAQYENGEIPFVDFSTITSFKWDQLYIVGPFSSYRELTYHLGVSWMKCYTNTYSTDGVVFFVFASDKKIVRCFDYPVDPYVFTSVASGSGISVQDARFILHEEYVGFLNGK